MVMGKILFIVERVSSHVGLGRGNCKGNNRIRSSPFAHRDALWCMIAPRFLTSKLLLAMPGIGDPRFERAVIAICNHDENGALGIGIGHVMPRLGLHALLRQFEIDPGETPDVAVHRGGPVEPQRGFVLHSLDWGGDGTVQVADRWGLTGTIDALRAVVSNKGPSRWLVALGYAGWGEGQLDSEMLRHGWHVTEASDALVFDTPVSERWSDAFVTMGIDPRMLAADSGHA
jgi:putative transcriptional regulator